MKIILAVAVIALAAAVYPYRHYAPPTKTVVTVEVIWVADEAQAARYCGSPAIGCWIKGEYSPDLLVVPKPRDFNDHRRLTILGHELLHALGAEHD